MLVDLRMGRVETEYKRSKLAGSYPKRDRGAPEAAAAPYRHLRPSRFIQPVRSRKTAASS